MAGINVPQRQVLGPTIRLPLVQHISTKLTRALGSSMMTADALRRGGTSRSGIAKGPLPAVQVFTHMPGDLGPNSPSSMAPGITRSGNYKAGVGQGRGQSQGM